MPFLTDLATHIKTWANGKFQLALPTPVGQSGKVVSSDGTTFVLTTPATGASETFSFANTTTTLTLGTAGYYTIEVAVNSAFVLTSVTTGKYYTFCVKNTGAATITISLPSGSLYSNGTADITSGYAREFSMVYDGTKMRWQISELLLNA